jgi:hypothetical protein
MAATGSSSLDADLSGCSSCQGNRSEASDRCLLLLMIRHGNMIGAPDCRR